jgi:hypothetical protein
MVCVFSPVSDGVSGSHRCSGSPRAKGTAHPLQVASTAGLGHAAPPLPVQLAPTGGGRDRGHPHLGYEDGPHTHSALTNGARVFVPLCVVGVRLTVAIHTFCGAEPRLQCVYL